MKELSGGARIHYIFNDAFGNELANLDATVNSGDQNIRTAILNSTAQNATTDHELSKAKVEFPPSGQ